MKTFQINNDNSLKTSQNIKTLPPMSPRYLARIKQQLSNEEDKR